MFYLISHFPDMILSILFSTDKNVNLVWQIFTRIQILANNEDAGKWTLLIKLSETKTNNRSFIFSMSLELREVKNWQNSFLCIDYNHKVYKLFVGLNFPPNYSLNWLFPSKKIITRIYIQYCILMHHIMGIWLSVKSLLVSNLLNQPIKCLQFPAYSRNW